jgi:hypothetical protein
MSEGSLRLPRQRDRQARLRELPRIVGYRGEELGRQLGKTTWDDP